VKADHKIGLDAVAMRITMPEHHGDALQGLLNV